MIISGAGNSQNYSFFNVNQSGNQKTPEAYVNTDKYIPSVSDTSATYNMFGNIQKNIFDSFANENSFMSGIREVFDTVENKALSAKDLVDAAAESEEFEKEGSWLAKTTDGRIYLFGARNAYFRDGGGNANVGIIGGENVVYDAGNGNNITTVYGSSGVVSMSGNGNDTYNIFYTDSAIINSGAGNDSFRIVSSDGVDIDTGDGDDKVYIRHSSDVRISTGSGNDTIAIDDKSSSVVINSGDGNDIITSSSGIIDAGKGDDIIHASGIINGGDGNDTIDASGMVYGDDGDDVISGGGIVYGGSGSDEINWNGYISGGTGNDHISLRSSLAERDNIISFQKGDGNDVINTRGEDVIVDMSTLSINDVEISQYINEDTGLEEMKITLKDGSGSMTFASDKHLAEMHENAVAFGKQMGWTPTKESISFIPSQIVFADANLVRES